MDEIENTEALKEIHNSAPGFFVVRYHQEDGNNLERHQTAWDPRTYMHTQGNLGKYLAVRQ